MDAAQDNDLLQAFLVEAGELLDSLDEQLIELERNPTEGEMLNAVFRAFHTVKGGAGFLGAVQMVELCHHAEDLLNDARAGRLTLSADHVDALLQALDLLQQMMRTLEQGSAPEPPPAELLARLQSPLATGASPAAPVPLPSAAPSGEAATPKPTAPAPAEIEAPVDPVNDAFDALLDMAYEHHNGAGTGDSDGITESEFEALLDKLYGDGGAPGMPAGEAPAGSRPTPAAKAADAPIDDGEFEALLDELHGDGGAPGKTPAPGRKDTIEDDEFEALLDQLHGSGGAPGGAAPTTAAAPVASPVPTPAAAAAPAAAARPAPMASAAPETRPPARAESGRGNVHAAAEASVRVDTNRLDALVNAAGELILVRNRLSNLAARGADPAMERAVNELVRVADHLQGAALRMRMQPIGRLFQRFPRIVRDLARQLGKDIDLVLEGEDTHLDRTLVEALADPLIHLLRNAVDHGIEDPAEREREEKPGRGTVRLSAGQEGERIIIRISDDGRGMDPDKLRAKAVEKGLIDADRAAQLEPSECYELIFAPGFSTREQISDISGRGVGMDVVKTRVAELGGTIGIDSEKGHGSTMRISIPLTLAILRVLMVRVGTRLLALPMSNVKEVFELGPGQMRELDGGVVAAHRGRPLPLSDLAQWAGVGGSSGGPRHVVLLHIGHQHLGCVVHEVLGREEVMIKPLGRALQHLPGIAGATITGDGRIALVLDLVALISGSRLAPPLRDTA